MSQAETLDPNALAMLLENFSSKPDLIAAVLDDFHESVGRLHYRIRHGIETGDATDMARAAHSLKSNAATLGALGMADVLKEIEAIGADGQTAGCADLLARSETIYRALIPSLAAVADIAGDRT